ncbi:hypothetical protein [Nocardia testacea]|nr:hypothetical protein [Nocardia testacea]
MSGPQREPLSPNVAHMAAAAIGSFVTVLLLGVVWLVRIGVLG